MPVQEATSKAAKTQRLWCLPPYTGHESRFLRPQITGSLALQADPALSAQQQQLLCLELLHVLQTECFLICLSELWAIYQQSTAFLSHWPGLLCDLSM